MNKGVLYALTAYILWGFYPIYFKELETVPATQIMAHRVVWSFFVLGLVVLVRGDLAQLIKSLNRRNLAIYASAGVLLSINWFTYVWAVTSGHVVESSLGYFINPLVSVVLGVLFLREKLRPLQWLPVGLAFAGVVYLTVSLGQLPWISLVLAFSFGTYGLIKKVAPLSSLHGLTLETAALFLPALGFLLVEEFRGAGSFIHAGAHITLLLSLAGFITVIPLILFVSGARLIPLSMVGILQYVSPSMLFLIGVYFYHEPFTTNRLIGFVIIWLALLIYSIEGVLHQRLEKSMAASRNHPLEEKAIP